MAGSPYYLDVGPPVEILRQPLGRRSPTDRGETPARSLRIVDDADGSVLIRYSPDQPRDEHGRFGEGDGGDTGDGGDSPNPFDAPYAEYNLNADGSPRFSATYTAKYGQVTDQYNIASVDGQSDQYSIVTTENGSFHIADDTRGTQNREVLQEFKDPAEAYFLGQSIDQVTEPNSDFPQGFTTTDGFGVHPVGDGLQVTWTDGDKTVFTADQAAELVDGLTVMAGSLDSAFRSLRSSRA